MKEKCFMINVMDMVDNSGQTEVIMKVSGNIIELMVKEDLFMQMEMFMTDNGKMIKVN
jgi:hypothetical protein